ncbi:MAG: hypothetical protein V1873_05480 [Verrucomicrobiota bacterium]
MTSIPPTEPGTSAPVSARGPRPPKILGQITLEVLPRSAETTVDLAPAAPTQAPRSLPEPMPGVRTRAAGRMIAAFLVAMIVLAGLAAYGPRIADWFRGSEPDLKALFGGGAARQPGRAWSPSTPGASLPLRPRFSLPAPPEPAAGPVLSQDALEQVDRQLAEVVSGGEGGLRPFVGKAALTLIDPQYKLSERELASLGRDEAKVISLYQDMFLRLARNLGQSHSRQSDLEYLKMEYGRLLDGLEEQKKLEITKLVLCRGVSGYGRYEAFYDNRFRLGSLPLILVYTELANSKPQLRPDGRYVVRLTEELTLFDGAAQEKEVWKGDPVSVTDESSSKRRDFFLAQYLRLPGTIQPGNYNLRVQITDNADGTAAVASIPLTVAAR